MTTPLIPTIESGIDEGFVDYSGELAQIELELRAMGLSKHSATFKDILQRDGGFTSLAMVPGDRLPKLLSTLSWYRGRQPPEILAALRAATTLAQKVYPSGRNVWATPSLSRWRDQHRPLTMEALESLVRSLAELAQESKSA